MSVTVEAVDGGFEVTCAPLLCRLFSVVRPGDVSVTVEAVDGGSEVTCAPLLCRLFSVVRPGTCLSRWRPWTEGLR